ncbi:uncharacterized protein Fot_45392 [Forsythia ovata]|uniref:Uncharacterized protein n=1 Tax=Forsythia ovata TaxID=205694 RepID=A0ABD1R6A4_9LAMI
MSFHYFILIKCFALTAATAITELKGEAAVIPSRRRQRSVYIASPELDRHYAFVPTVTSYLISPLTTSRRIADRKVGKFEKNITKRRIVPEASTKKGNNYPVGPVLLGFFVFVVIGSSLFQIIRTATSGGMT